MRIFLILCFIFIQINASNIKKNLILNKLISENAIDYKSFKSFNFEKEKLKNIYVKIQLNKKLLQNKTYYLKVIYDKKAHIYSNVKYQNNVDSIIFKLDKNTPKEIKLNLKLEKKNFVKLAFLRLNEFEYNYILKKESLLYGIAYGIIFCAFLYNLAIFLYTFQKAFLYYSLMQLFLIIVLYYSVILESQTFITVTQQILTDFCETACVLLMILFSKEILNTKKYMKKIDKILNFLVYISVVDLITIFIFNYSLLYRYIPRTIIISILVIAGLIAIFKAQKVAIFYFLGWLVVLVCLFITELNLSEINELYIIHIGLPIESLILSFALGYKLKLKIEEDKEKEKMLIQQSKLASMGEMLNNIAHQWRQPLNNLSFINLDLKMAMKNNDISNNYLQEITNDSLKQIDFMSETLDNFKGFYQPNRKKEYFYISEAVQSAINIVKPTLEKENIKLAFNLIKDKKIVSYKNEYIQVILNILTNAKDALVDKKIENPFIKVKLEMNSDKKSILSISDNAQGIKEEIINNIFNPYFTTKHGNSGIGLYMTKIIIESHLKGHIKVENTPIGACFKIKI